MGDYPEIIFNNVQMQKLQYLTAGDKRLIGIEFWHVAREVQVTKEMAFSTYSALQKS